MPDCDHLFIVFGFRQTQPHAFNKLQHKKYVTKTYSIIRQNTTFFFLIF